MFGKESRPFRRQKGEVDRRECVKTSEGDGWDLPLDLDFSFFVVRSHAHAFLSKVMGRNNRAPGNNA